MSATSDRVVRLGEICGAYGVKGWVRLRSFTEPASNLIDYPRWLLERNGRQQAVEVEAARASGSQLVAKLAGVDDRDAALALVGTAIGVPRASLPPCSSGEYYWTDLEGLRVLARDGTTLGRVVRLIATGANDVLVLDGPGERLIPYLPGQVIDRVDLAAGCIVVDWDPSYWE